MQQSKNRSRSASFRSRDESASSIGVEMTKNAPSRSPSRSAFTFEIHRTSAPASRSASTFSTASRSSGGPITTHVRFSRFSPTGKNAGGSGSRLIVDRPQIELVDRGVGEHRRRREMPFPMCRVDASPNEANLIERYPHARDLVVVEALEHRRKNRIGVPVSNSEIAFVGLVGFEIGTRRLID